MIRLIPLTPLLPCHFTIPLTKSGSCIKGLSIIQIPLSGRTKLAESFHEKMSSFVNVVKAYSIQWKKSVLLSLWKNSIGAKFRVMIDIEGRLSLFSILPHRRYGATNHIIAMVRIYQLGGSGSFTCSFDFYSTCRSSQPPVGVKKVEETYTLCQIMERHLTKVISILW